MARVTQPKVEPVPAAQSELTERARDDSEPSPDRAYRAPALRYAAALAAAVGAASIGLVVIDHAGALAIALIALATIACWIMLIVVVRRPPLVETPGGLISQSLFGRRCYPWADIEEIRSGGARVYVKTGHRVHALVGVAQGSRMAWQNGSTHDIVAVLNARIAIFKSGPNEPPQGS